MTKIVLTSLCIIVSFAACSNTNFVRKNKIIKIIPTESVSWDIDECEEILNLYTVDNASIINQKVFIKALLLNNTSIQAIARKEVIEKRLEEKEYYPILDKYLREFTSFKFDYVNKEIIELDTNFTKGYAFKIYFENISNPYQPIFLEDGYSYFFLENMNGDFSRVTEVSGLFVEDYFQLDGYLDVIITFSPFSNSGRRLFKEKNLNESYKLVFNGLEKFPIGIIWGLE